MRVEANSIVHDVRNGFDFVDGIIFSFDIDVSFLREDDSLLL